MPPLSLRLQRNRRAVDEPLSAQLRALMILRARRDEKFSSTEADSTEADLAKADLAKADLKVRPTCGY